MGFDVKENRDSKGQPINDIVCKKSFFDNDVKSVLSACNTVNHLQGIQKINISYDTETEKFWSRRNPLIPMVISTGVTFFTIHGVIQQLDPTLTSWDYFNLAGIPSIVTFLAQLGFEFSKKY